MTDKNKDGLEFEEGAEARAMARDKLIFNTTDDLLIIMEDQQVSKSELARRLGKSKSYVTQVLSGRRNMTLGSLADICFALRFEPKIALPVQEIQEENEGSFGQNKGHRPWSSVDKKPAFETSKTALGATCESATILDLELYKEYKKCG